MLKSIILAKAFFICSIVALEEIDVGDPATVIFNKFNWTSTSKLCVDPGKVRHSSREPVVDYDLLYPYGTILHYTCFSSFRLAGDSNKLVCGINGQWEPPNLPSCQPVYCSPPAIPFGYVASIRNNFTPKSNVEVRCKDGYRLLNKFVNKLECQNDGSWIGHNGDFTQEIPECIESTCPPLPEVDHASVIYKGSQGGDRGFREEAIAEYSCHSGFLMNNISNSSYVIRTYCHNGVWVGLQAFECKLVGCSPPSLISHGSREILRREGDKHLPGIAYPVGITITYWCNPGYVLKGASFKYHCMKNGSWQPLALPTCEKLEIGIDFPDEEITCGKPPSIKFAYTLDSRDHYYPMSTVNFFCHGGFRLVGPSQLQCDDDGEWQPKTFPFCEIILEKPAFDWGSFERTSPSSNRETTIVNEPESQTVSLVTAGCVLGFLSVILILAVAYQRRRCRSRFNHVQLQQPINVEGSNTQISQYQDQDRVSLIAFADGAHLTLPTYEESIRQRNPVAFNPPPTRSSSRYSRFAMHRTCNPDQISNGTTRQHSSHSGWGRSASIADSLGSNDTVTPSEVSTTVTVDTLSSNASHTASAASIRGFCGSLASFDTTGSGSILNIEGVPLLEEGDNEKESMTVTVNHIDVV